MQALPTIPVSQHNFTNPLLKKPIRYSAYVTGQESLLIQNKDMSDSDKLLAIKQVLEQVTNGYDVDSLPFAVIEHLFCGVRSKSAGEEVPVRYTCKNVTGQDEDGVDVVCKAPISFDVNLEEVQFVIPEGFTDTIKLDEATGIGVKMKLPNIEVYEQLGEGAAFQDMVAYCIDCIFQGDQVFSAADRTHEELLAWWNSLITSNKMKVVNQFFTLQPHILYEHHHTCKCGHVHDFRYTKLNHFFI